MSRPSRDPLPSLGRVPAIPRPGRMLLVPTLLILMGGATAQAQFGGSLFNGDLDPFNKNNKLGGSVKLPRVRTPQESTSGLAVISGPSMDRDGYISGGSSRSDAREARVGRGQLRHDGMGRAWWHSSYANRFGRVNSPVRAFAKYDRVEQVRREREQQEQRNRKLQEEARLRGEQRIIQERRRQEQARRLQEQQQIARGVAGLVDALAAGPQGQRGGQPLQESQRRGPRGPEGSGFPPEGIPALPPFEPEGGPPAAEVPSGEPPRPETEPEGPGGAIEVPTGEDPPPPAGAEGDRPAADLPSGEDPQSDPARPESEPDCPPPLPPGIPAPPVGPGGGPPAGDGLTWETTPPRQDALFAPNLGIHYERVPYEDGTFGAKLTRDPLPGSPAAALQLEPGDTIFEMDGQRFRQPADVLNHQARTPLAFVNVRTNAPQSAVIDIP